MAGDFDGRWAFFGKLVPVLMVLTLISFLYIEFAFIHCGRLLQWPTPEKERDPAEVERATQQLGVFHVITVFLMFCFWKCCRTFPGTVPDGAGWDLHADIEGPESAASGRYSVIEKKHTGERRVCKWCLKYKPDRCHHCRACNVCVLRMDHHCPWVFNCIGFRNHKYFFLLLVYSVADLLYIGICMFETVWWSTRIDVSVWLMVALIIGEVLSSLLLVLAFLFLSFHTWLMLKAMSTVEFCEKAMKNTSYDSSIYSLIFYNNVCNVLGPNPLLWFLPVSMPLGDGLVWVTSSGSTGARASLIPSAALAASSSAALVAAKGSDVLAADAAAEGSGPSTPEH